MIDKENQARLEQMSVEEIEEERTQLLKVLRPSLVARLMRRGENQVIGLGTEIKSEDEAIGNKSKDWQTMTSVEAENAQEGRESLEHTSHHGTRNHDYNGTARNRMSEALNGPSDSAGTASFEASRQPGIELSNPKTKGSKQTEESELDLLAVAENIQIHDDQLSLDPSTPNLQSASESKPTSDFESASDLHSPSDLASIAKSSSTPKVKPKLNSPTSKHLSMLSSRPSVMNQPPSSIPPISNLPTSKPPTLVTADLDATSKSSDITQSHPVSPQHPPQPNTSTKPNLENTAPILNLAPLDPSAPNFLHDLHDRYFPRLPHNPAALAWMAPLPTVSPAAQYTTPEYSAAPDDDTLPASSLRFDFSGRLLPPRLAHQLPTTLGLHHHSVAPAAAGYTLPELARLARSNVPAQRCMAYQTLGRVLFRLGTGIFGQQGEELYEGLWACIDEGRVLDILVAEAGREEYRGNESCRVTAIEAVWLWRRGGGKRMSAQ